MKLKLLLAARIRAMKIGDSFPVTSERDRKEAISIGKALKDSGVIDFDITTKKKGDAFKVYAIK